MRGTRLANPVMLTAASNPVGYCSTPASYGERCVCRVCVGYEFYAFYALYAFTESVTYGKMEGQKVQVPSPALPYNQLSHRCVMTAVLRETERDWYRKR